MVALMEVRSKPCGVKIFFGTGFACNMEEDVAVIIPKTIKKPAMQRGPTTVRFSQFRAPEQINYALYHRPDPRFVPSF